MPRLLSSNSRALALAIVLAFATLAAGCSGKRAPTAPPGGEGGPPPTGVARAFASRMPADFVVPNTVDSAASLVVASNVVLGTTGAGTPFAVPVAAAAFLNATALVQAGEVSVSTTTDSMVLDTLYFPYQGAPSTMYTTLKSNPSGADLTFDGSTEHVFGALGSAAFPSFHESLQSVSPATVTVPGQHQPVSRSTNLTVYWANPGTDTTVYVTATIVDEANSSIRVSTGVTRDVGGQLVIPSSTLLLMPFTGGYSDLNLTRYRLVYRTIGGRKVGFMSSAVSTVVVHLN